MAVVLLNGPLLQVSASAGWSGHTVECYALEL